MSAFAQKARHWMRRIDQDGRRRRYAISVMLIIPVEVDVELKAAIWPGVTVKYSAGALALIFMLLDCAVAETELPITR